MRIDTFDWWRMANGPAFVPVLFVLSVVTGLVGQIPLHREALFSWSRPKVSPLTVGSVTECDRWTICDRRRRHRMPCQPIRAIPQPWQLGMGELIFPRKFPMILARQSHSEIDDVGNAGPPARRDETPSHLESSTCSRA